MSSGHFTAKKMLIGFVWFIVVCVVMLLLIHFGAMTTMGQKANDIYISAESELGPSEGPHKSLYNDDEDIYIGNKIETWEEVLLDNDGAPGSRMYVQTFDQPPIVTPIFPDMNLHIVEPKIGATLQWDKPQTWSPSGYEVRALDPVLQVYAYISDVSDATVWIIPRRQSGDKLVLSVRGYIEGKPRIFGGLSKRLWWIEPTPTPTPKTVRIIMEGTGVLTWDSGVR